MQNYMLQHEAKHCHMHNSNNQLLHRNSHTLKHLSQAFTYLFDVRTDCKISDKSPHKQELKHRNFSNPILCEHNVNSSSLLTIKNQTVSDGVAHSKNARKCVYHVTFDLDLEHTPDSGSPGDHPVQVWSRSSHLPGRRSDFPANTEVPVSRNL